MFGQLTARHSFTSFRRSFDVPPSKNSSARKKDEPASISDQDEGGGGEAGGSLHAALDWFVVTNTPPPLEKLEGNICLFWCHIKLIKCDKSVSV